MKKLKILATCILAGTLGFSASYAATDGTVGVTSTGSSVVSLTLPKLFKISELSDISLAPTNLTVDAVGETTACVYSSGVGYGGTFYDETGTSANAVNGYPYAVAANGDKLEYRPYFLSKTGAASFFMSGVRYSRGGANQTSKDCGGVMNSGLRIVFTPGFMATVPGGGPYTDTMTLLIQPI